MCQADAVSMHWLRLGVHPGASRLPSPRACRIGCKSLACSRLRTDSAAPQLVNARAAADALCRLGMGCLPLGTPACAPDHASAPTCIATEDLLIQVDVAALLSPNLSATHSGTGPVGCTAAQLALPAVTADRPGLIQISDLISDSSAQAPSFYRLGRTCCCGHADVESEEKLQP